MPNLISTENAYFYIMKLLVYFFVLAIFWSCKQDNFNKVDANDIANKQLQTIDFKQIDRFPLFKTCDETASRRIQQNCFEQHLHQWLKPYIDTIEVEIAQTDTLLLFLKIDKTGKIKLDSLYSKMDLSNEFQRIFNKSPQIYPAQKRGVPVSVNLELPVILSLKSK